jgi:hypothetical protein
MNSKVEPFVAIGVMGLIALTFWLASTPPPTINGEVLIPEKHKNVHLIRHKDEVDGTLEVIHKPSGDKFKTDFVDNNHYQQPSQKDSGKWGTSLSRDYYLIDPGLDWGTYAGWASDHKRDHGDSDFKVGLRFSPARLLFGTVAPDLLIGSDAAGVGVSVYPPKSFFGGGWNHVGIGVGRVYDYDDHDPSTLYYLGFSTRF